MKSRTLIGLLAVMIVCSCGKTKKEETLQPVKVKTETVGEDLASNEESYTGTVEEMSGVSLSFTVGGTLKQLNVDEGQMVAKGQLIGVTDGQDARNSLEMTQANVESARSAYKQALDAYNRMKMIHDKGSLADIKWVEAQSDLERAKSALEAAEAQSRIARKSVGDTRLFAPFGGYIIKKNVEIGQTVSPGMPIVNLVQIDNVKVKISIPESEVSSIHNGTTVSIRVDALGGRQYTGRITEKNINGNALSHTYEVKAVVANGDHKLLPGMIAEVQVKGARSTSDNGNPSTHGTLSAIVLPAGIIQLNDDNRTFVWLAVNGKAEKRFVVTGDNVGDKIAILGGLQSGDKVIIQGQQKVSSGMAVSER